MRLFVCKSCDQLVFFENFSCVRCGAVLGFVPENMYLETLEGNIDGTWRIAGAGPDSLSYRHCANRIEQQVCNWMVPAMDANELCLACRLNKTIPDLSIPVNIELWSRLETEKRRLVYSLLRLRLPVVPQMSDPAGLAFDFLADSEPRFNESGRVLTGHSEGLITINIAEADPVMREKMKNDMSEPYRTILGHFRHESGHYYWDRLIRDSRWLEPFRSLMGDETFNYAQALQRHYENGPPADWPRHFVSAYASTHPWEDWAESWAHFLHIVDTMETAYEYGLRVKPRVGSDEYLRAEAGFDPYVQTDFQTLIEHWFPLTYALNCLNRSMGHDHLYPFVLSSPAVEKLKTVHMVIASQQAVDNPKI